MIIKLHGTHLEITPEVRTLVTEKIMDSIKSLGDLNTESVHINVELERTSHRHLNERNKEKLYRAEANVSLPGHQVRVEESAMELEKAIVQLKHTLTRDLRKWREKKYDSRRKGARMAKQMVGTSGTAQPEIIDDSILEDWDNELTQAATKKEIEDNQKWSDWEEISEHPDDLSS